MFVAAAMAAPSEYGSRPEYGSRSDYQQKAVSKVSAQEWEALNPIKSDNYAENEELKSQWARFLK